VVVLILLNGVFAGAEIAVLSVRKTRLQELVDAGSRSAEWVAGLRQNPERFLATIQVGITVVSTTAAAFGGASVAERLAPVIAAVPGLEHSADQIALTAVVLGISYLSLVLGELVPKSLALRAAESYALVIARPLAGLGWVARPLVWLLTGSSNLVLRLFGDRTSFVESRLSSEELQQLVDEAATAGTVDPNAGEIAFRALHFSELDASMVMVPRADMVAVARTASMDELAQVALRTGHSRVLVYGADPDDVVGFVNVRDTLARARVEPGYDLEKALLPVPFVPVTMVAPSLLRDLQRRRSNLAVVVDESGTLRGLVTIEDLVEELVGDIVSEGDRPHETVVRESDGVLVVDGAVPIHELNREYDLSLPEGESTSTVGGLVLEIAGRIPAPGDKVTAESVEIEVVEATHRKIKRVRIRC
jgi:putative hemolysin